MLILSYGSFGSTDRRFLAWGKGDPAWKAGSGAAADITNELCKQKWSHSNFPALTRTYVGRIHVREYDTEVVWCSSSDSSVAEYQATQAHG